MSQKFSYEFEERRYEVKKLKFLEINLQFIRSLHCLFLIEKKERILFLKFFYNSAE